MLLRSVILFSAVVLACAPAAKPASADGRLQVYTTILPAAWIVDRVGGDLVRTTALIEPGTDPHTFDPSPRKLAGLASAEVYFPLGVPFEHNLLDKIRTGFPGVKVQPIDSGIAFLQPLDEDDGDRDPHIWISPRQVKLLAANIAAVLSRLKPEGRTHFEANLAALQAELQALDDRLTQAFAPVAGGTFFVYHPSLAYLARDYGLIQEAVEMEGKAPSAQNLGRIIAAAKAKGIKVIFVQAEFDPSVARMVAEAIGGAVVPFNDLAYDYLTNLQALADQLKAALR